MALAPEILQFVQAHRDLLTLSVYLEGATNPSDRHEWRTELHNGLARLRARLQTASHEERETFEACVERLAERLPQSDAMLGAPGWAGFACSNGVIRAETLPVPVAVSVTWGRGARIAPYIEAVNPHPALVVVLTRQQATLYRLAGAELSKLEVIEARPKAGAGPHMGNSPRLGFHPGTRGETLTEAQDRHDRASAGQLATTVVRRIRALTDDDMPVVLGGAMETVTRIRESLPPGFAERTFVATALPARTTLAKTRRIAIEALSALRVARQRTLVAQVIERPHTHRHLALGLEPVSHAIDAGAVDLLLLSPAAVRSRPEETDNLIQRAFTEGADVEIVAPAAATMLDARAGGAAARLRHAVAETPPATFAPDESGSRALQTT